MITIDYKGDLQKVRTAVTCANSLLHDPKFYQNIREQESFDLADISPCQIAQLIQNADMPMRVIMYIASPRVHGYDDPFNIDLIHINVFRSDWTISGIVNSLIHQTVHAVNGLHRDCAFSHGYGEGEWQENTAPYRIAAIAEEMLTGKPGRTDMIHDDAPESLAIDVLN